MCVRKGSCNCITCIIFTLENLLISIAIWTSCYKTEVDWKVMFCVSSMIKTVQIGMLWDISSNEDYYYRKTLSFECLDLYMSFRVLLGFIFINNLNSELRIWMLSYCSIENSRFIFIMKSKLELLSNIHWNHHSHPKPRKYIS